MQMGDWIFDDVTISFGGTQVVKSATLCVSPGELVAVLGANGAGKSSLIKAGLGQLPTDSGKIALNGQNPRTVSPTARARQVAYLPQSRPLAWPLSVRDIVALGRFAYGAAPGRLSAKDAAAVEVALETCDIAHLGQRATNSLSGGELARVHIARALAAGAPLLVADEPTAALDPAQAFSILQVVVDFCTKGGAALIILHDISLAARFASRIIVMKHGSIIADDAPLKALTPAILQAAFGIKAQLMAMENGPLLSIEGLSV
jgi:iron complex transport system ATP-binding protein